MEKGQGTESLSVKGFPVGEEEWEVREEEYDLRFGGLSTTTTKIG
ncbi:hypothetical protein COLO4_05989 [Corchorus olitorius]|uniref:Uncharacterized protein n=1 Tax=Corchorus olitorius TaxID=93759 RepID=A0A1R3KP94_9ROSI|nr:hypothetical protein COLO4_05989 [Corchorus olitorius]